MGYSLVLCIDFFLNQIATHTWYEGHLESSQHGIITPQCADKMLSNNTFLETRIQWLLYGSIFVEKVLGVFKVSRVYTLVEILSKIFVNRKENWGPYLRSWYDKLTIWCRLNFY